MAESQTPKYIPLRLGTEEDDDANPPMGTVVDARNVRFSSVGAATPRPGSDNIPPTITNGGTGLSIAIQNNAEEIGAMFTVGNSGAMAIAGNVFAYDTVAQKFEAQGNYSTCQPVRKRSALSVLKESYGYRKFGLAVNTLGHVCYAASRDITSSVYFVVESKDGVSQIEGPLATYTKASVLAFGADFLIVCQAGTAIDAFKVTYSAGTWTIAPAVNIGTLNAATNFWDACVQSATVWHIAYQHAAANMRVQNWSFPVVAAIGGALTQGVTGQPVYSLWCDGVNVWLGWNDDPGVTGNVRVRIVTTGYVAVLAATTIATGVNYGPLTLGPARDGTVTKAFGYYTETKASASPFTVGTHVVDITTAAGTTTQDTWHVYPVGKPGAGGRIWCMTANKNRWAPTAPLGWQFSRNLLLRWTDLGNVEPPTVELATDEWEQVPTFVGRTDDTMLIAEANSQTSTFAMLRDVVFAYPSSDLLRLQLYEYEKTSQKPLRDVAICSPTALVAGQPVEIWSKGSSGTAIPGSIVRSGVPVGFAHRPAIVDAVQAGGGVLTPLGKYTWVAVVKWIDRATGRLHQSAPSSPYTATLTGANSQVTLTITGIMCDSRIGDTFYENRPVVSIYRTRAGEAQLREETSYLSTSFANAESIAHVSANPDGQLGTFLYTEGGVVQFDLAPSCRHIVRTESAVWFGGLWDRRQLKKSRDFFPGEPCESSDLESWNVYLPEECDGLAYQDGLLYAFSNNSVFLVTGDGPNEQGQGFFDPVRTLTSEFGLARGAAPSILETSVGVFFLSNRGFMLIPRGGGNPVFIGAKVQKSIRPLLENGAAGYFTCLGSTVAIGKSRTARFLMSNGSAERVYVYDLDTNAWSFDDYRQRSGGVESPSRLAAIGNWPSGFVAGRLDLTSALSCAYAENAAQYADACSDGSTEASITSYIRFGEMRPFGFAGWGRCQTVGYIMSEDFVDSGQTSVIGTVTPDALATSATTRTWSAVSSAGDGQTIYREIDLTHNECTSVVVEWSAVRPRTATVPGPSLNALMTMTVAEHGRRLLPPAER
jgi:hypothetical protein